MGFADVAVSVVRQPDADAAAAAESDMGHLTLDGPRSGGGDCGRPKGRLLARVAAGAAGAALQAAKGVPFRQQRGAWCVLHHCHISVVSFLLQTACGGAMPMHSRSDGP